MERDTVRRKEKAERMAPGVARVLEGRRAGRA